MGSWRRRAGASLLAVGFATCSAAAFAADGGEPTFRAMVADPARGDLDSVTTWVTTGPCGAEDTHGALDLYVPPDDAGADVEVIRFGPSPLAEFAADDGYAVLPEPTWREVVAELGLPLPFDGALEAAFMCLPGAQVDLDAVTLAYVGQLSFTPVSASEPPQSTYEEADLGLPGAGPTPTPTAAPTQSPATPLPSATPVPSETPAPSVTPSPSPTPSPSATPSASASPTPSQPPSPSPKPSPSPHPTATPTPAPTTVASPTPTARSSALPRTGAEQRGRGLLLGAGVVLLGSGGILVYAGRPNRGPAR